MTYETAQRRYVDDPEFHALVAHLQSLIGELKFTPAEIREAATFAGIRFEAQASARPRYVHENRQGLSLGDPSVTHHSASVERLQHLPDVGD